LFIASFKLPLNFFAQHRPCPQRLFRRRADDGDHVRQCPDKQDNAAWVRGGEAIMARMEMAESGLCAVPAQADAFFALGMMHAGGRDTAVDLIAAHQWFNIAAARGHVEAAQARREVAEQMSDEQIGRAQRAARDWLRQNPVAVLVPAPIAQAA